MECIICNPEGWCSVNVTICKINCPRCGNYKVAEETVRYSNHSISEISRKNGLAQETIRHHLSCYIRERTELGPPLRVITDLEALYQSVKIPTTMLEKAYKIISYLEKNSTSFEQEHYIDIHTDYPIAYAIDANELNSLLGYLNLDI